MATADWVRVRLPQGSVKTGAQEIAALCKWQIKHAQGDEWAVCVADRYFGRAPGLLRLEQVANAQTGSDPTRYDGLRGWHTQDEVVGPYTQAFGAELERLRTLATRPAAWRAFRTSIGSAPDGILADTVAAFYSRIAEDLPESSLWAVREDRAIEWRQSMIRVNFTLEVLPDYAHRAADQGNRASRGLSSPDRYGHALFIETLLLMCAPWVLGLAAPRRGGCVVLLFGNATAGRDPDLPPEPIEVLRPTLLAPPIRSALQAPDLTPDIARSALGWWVRQIDQLLGVALDVSCFANADGTYDPRRHFGLILTLDRLFVSVNTLLIYSRREEYSRRLLLFEVLDMLAGLNLGGYDPYLRPERARRTLDALEQQLPAAVAAVALPRCRLAVEKLLLAEQGFYVTERISTVGDVRYLAVPNKKGVVQPIALGRALALYINLVRDAGHSFEEKVRSVSDLALLASHDGELAPEISDLAVLFLLDLIANPEKLRSRLRRGAAQTR